MSDLVKQASRGERRETRARMREFRFERIEAWQLARQFNRQVYSNSRKFPKEEQFALLPQIRRASTSIGSNIAEGSGRNSDADFGHFLEIAYGSLMEVVSQLFVAWMRITSRKSSSTASLTRPISLPEKS